VELLNDLDDEFGPQVLLKEIAARGGITDHDPTYPGEARYLWEMRDLCGGSGRDVDRLAKPVAHAGTIGGVGFVLRHDGLSLAEMADSFRLDPAWSQTISTVGDLLEAVARAKREVDDRQPIERHVSRDWWKHGLECAQ
jgi:hypothetical protein